MKKSKILSMFLAVLFFVFSLPFYVGQSDVSVKADSAKTSVFNGVALTKLEGAGNGGVMLEQYALSTMDLSSAKYLAIRYYNYRNDSWPFYFIAQQNNGFLYLADGTQYTIYDDNFNFVENRTVQYNALTATPASSGYIVMPASVFAGLATIQALYIELPGNTAPTVELHFNKVGYYAESNPDLVTDMVTLTDFSTWTEEWFVNRETNAASVDLSLTVAPATGLIGGVQLTQTGFTDYAEEGLMINKFDAGAAADVGAVDISNVEYFAFEYANLTSAGSATRIVMQDTAAQFAVATGTTLTYLNHDFSVAKTVETVNPYIYADAGVSGWIVIPKSAFVGVVDMQTKLGNTLAASYLLWVSYTADLNTAGWQFGKILTYTDETITDYSAGTVIADPAKWTDADVNARRTGASSVAFSRVQAPEYTVTKTVNGVARTGVLDVDTKYAPMATAKAGSAFIGWKYTDGVQTAWVTDGITVKANCTLEALYVDFETKGVDIKTSDTKGLRFTSRVSAESKAMLAALGLQASYGTKLTNPELGYLYIPVTNWFDNEETTFTAVLKGFNASQYALEFTAQAYVEIGGVKYFAEATQAGSMAKTAYDMLNGNLQLTQAQRDYLTTVAEKYVA